MNKLTEKQRLEAIASCDRIVELNDDLQQRLQNILRILERASKPVPEPEDRS